MRDPVAQGLIPALRGLSFSTMILLKIQQPLLPLQSRFMRVIISHGTQSESFKAAIILFGFSRKIDFKSDICSIEPRVAIQTRTKKTRLFVDTRPYQRM
jgi:hypothetical protein